MWLYISKRIIQLFIALFTFSFISFVLIRQLPGSAAFAVYGANAQRLTEEELIRIEQALFQHQSIFQQYGEWLIQVMNGDFGYSFSQQQAIAELLQQQANTTIWIVVQALVLVNILIVMFVLVLRNCKYQYVTKIINGFLVANMIVPAFWLSFLLIALLSMKLQWFPLYGIGQGDVRSMFNHLMLPSLSLALPMIFYGVKLIETELHALNARPFMKYVKQRSLSNWRIAKHALPHLTLSVLQMNGLFFTSFVGGTIAIETIFSIPGIGRLTMEATKYHDYPMLMMIILSSLTVVMVVHVLIDIISSYIDPRVYKSLKD